MTVPVEPNIKMHIFLLPHSIDGNAVREWFVENDVPLITASGIVYFLNIDDFLKFKLWCPTFG